MRRQGLPFIVGGVGVGPVFAFSSSVNCCENCRGICRAYSVPIGKIANGVFVLSLWLSWSVAVPMGETANRVAFEGVKGFKLEEVAYEIRFF